MDSQTASRPRQDFPAKALLLASGSPIVPLALLVTVHVLGGGLNIHGPSGLLILVLLLWEIASFALTAGFLLLAVAVLVRDPKARSLRNISITTYGLIFIIAVLIHFSGGFSYIL
jgi:hypothetical protein